jgi:NTE family protein
MTRRAVVLGAGGPAGIAWEVGVVAGLQDAGTGLRDADLFVGTSAGSVVATQITSGLAIEKMFQQQVDPNQQVKEVMPPTSTNSEQISLARGRVAAACPKSFSASAHGPWPPRRYPKRSGGT